MLLYPGVCKKVCAYLIAPASWPSLRIHARQVMQLYGTRSLEGGTFLRADYGVRHAAAGNTSSALTRELAAAP